jgi:hypothetical protein
MVYIFPLLNLPPYICWLRSKAILENMTLLEVQEYFLVVLGCKMIVKAIGRLDVGESLHELYSMRTVGFSCLRK